MLLREWMALEGLDDKRVAELVGLHRTAISKIRRGKRRPSYRVLAAIERVTGGAVTGSDFFAPEERSAA